MDYPTKAVDTKFGTITLTFLDPDEQPTHCRYGHEIGQYDRPVAWVSGDVVVNRVPVSLYASLVWATRYSDDSGHDLPEPRKYLTCQSGSIYHKRTGTYSSDLPDGVRRKLWDLWDGEVRVAYEAATDLQHEAKRARLVNAMEGANNLYETKLRELSDAERALREAAEAVEAFDNG